MADKLKIEWKEFNTLVEKIADKIQTKKDGLKSSHAGMYLGKGKFLELVAPSNN